MVIYAMKEISLLSHMSHTVLRIVSLIVEIYFVFLRYISNSKHEFDAKFLHNIKFKIKS